MNNKATVKNPYANMLLGAPRDGGFRMEDYYVWCGSVIRAEEDGKYHMFASRWERKYGFGHNWLYRSEVVRAVSDTPTGPFTYAETVLPVRDPVYFDGRNTHNPMIRYWNGTYYLYYMGTTYAHEPPTGDALRDGALAERTWNSKRIGLATAPSIYGPWTRRDTPLLEPREAPAWDCTVTTNPAVAILPDGTTYMLYKSRACAGGKLQIGVARAPRPDGPFERLSDEPIFNFPNPDFHVEDPYLWYEDGRFRLIIKDDFKNGCGGVTGVWGSGFYAESDDCIHWEIADDPIVYTRRIRWEDGEEQDCPNAERPFLLTENGRPVCLYLATGKGRAPYVLEHSWNQAIPCQWDR